MEGLEATESDDNRDTTNTNNTDHDKSSSGSKELYYIIHRHIKCRHIFSELCVFEYM